MPQCHDYAETRACLERLVAALEDARLAAGRANLPPALSPRSIRMQIDDLESMVAAASAEITAARDACIRAGRRGLSVVSD